MPEQRILRTYVYIDGLNLYYLALRNTSYKWLDLKVLCKRFLKPERHNIIKIRYFTTQVLEDNSGKFIRQKTYLEALKTFSEIEIHYVFFLRHKIKAVKAPLTIPKEYCQVYKTEEKCTDVNLATHLMNDYHLNKFDCAVIIANDSDYKEPLKLIKERNNKVLGIICPNVRGYLPKQLRENTRFRKKIRPNILKASQLPEIIPGTKLKKPETW